MKSILFVLCFVSCAAIAEPCFGPGGCIVVNNDPIGPKELCIRNQCMPVTYSWYSNIVVAESLLPNGYSVLGWAGPCLSEDHTQCPDIFNQAFSDLRSNALRANRAQQYER